MLLNSEIGKLESTWIRHLSLNFEYSGGIKRTILLADMDCATTFRLVMTNSIDSTINTFSNQPRNQINMTMVYLSLTPSDIM